MPIDFGGLGDHGMYFVSRSTHADAEEEHRQDADAIIPCKSGAGRREALVGSWLDFSGAWRLHAGAVAVRDSPFASGRAKVIGLRSGPSARRERSSGW